MRFIMEFFRNVFTDSERKMIESKTLESDSWKFGHYSSSKTHGDDFPFWQLELSNDTFFTEHLFNKIQELTKRKYNLKRVYANGQTHGLVGSVHQDDSKENTYTFLYYANPAWRNDWGGDTVFYNHDGTIMSIFPYPNSAVIFDSRIPHFGTDPNRKCPTLRVTVAWKLEEI